MRVLDGGRLAMAGLSAVLSVRSSSARWAADPRARRGAVNTRGAGTSHCGQGTVLGAVPMGADTSSGPCSAQRYTYTAMRPLPSSRGGRDPGDGALVDGPTATLSLTGSPH